MLYCCVVVILSTKYLSFCSLKFFTTWFSVFFIKISDQEPFVLKNIDNVQVRFFFLICNSNLVFRFFCKLCIGELAGQI